mmetsp:Transcript_6922/g.21414  ORF Transcript_6922/g.21414 Transcript_6922/m.21414 type:complete len:391 (-) Transcript_6922:85-1257(-)
MTRARSRGLRVVLAGDLNAAWLPTDRHWTFKSVDAAMLPAWPRMQQALRQRTVVEVTTTNPRTGDTFQKWRCKVQREDGSVFMGSHCLSRDEAFFELAIDGLTIGADGELREGGIDADEDEDADSSSDKLVARAPNLLNVRDFRDLADKLGGVQFSDAELQRLVRENPSTFLKDELVGEDDMVDSFAALHPEARDRFTCWDQYRNQRHENKGSRIDFVFVDAPLFREARPVAGALDCGGVTDVDENSSRAARAAATRNGGFRPAPFEGGGLPEPAHADVLHHLRTPHTGVVYTPPSWSDHVAVSLCLAALPVQAAAVQEEEGCRRRRLACQPHAQLPTITAFFKPRSESSASSSVVAPTTTTAAARTKPPSKPPPPPKGIRKFFQTSSAR